MDNSSVFQNSSDVQQPEESYDEYALLVFLLLGILITLGNTLSILVFWKRRFVLKRTTLILLNLTFADLMVGFVAIGLILGAFLTPDDETSQDLFTKIIVPFDSFTGLASFFFLVAISLERTYAISCPLRHRAIATRYYVIAIFVVWFLAGFSSVLISLSLCGLLSNKVAVTVVSVFVGFSLLVTWFSYLTIWIKSSKRVYVPHANTAMRAEQHRKLTKTLFVVTLFSLIAWLPFQIIFTLVQFFPGISIPGSTVIITRLLQFTNSLLNPIVYNLNMPEFRKTLKRLMCGCLIKNSPQVDIRLQSLQNRQL